MATLLSKDLLRRLACVGILAVALGYTEACVVVYLRELLVPLRTEHFPAAVDELLPLLTVQQLRKAGHVYVRLLAVEISREITPLVVLLAAAWALRRRRGQLGAFFLVGFGLWDIFYYVFLKVLLDWPESLGTWDVLYLIPTAWVGPVWAPLVVSGTMVLAGLAILRRESPQLAGIRRLVAWLLLSVGAGVVLTSFFLRTHEAFGSVPARFDWPVFLAGWALAVAALAWWLWPRRAGGRR